MNGFWQSKAYLALLVVFVMLMLVSIENSRIGIMRSKQSIELSQLGITSIAPGNLRNAPDEFLLELRAEDRDFPADDMTKLKAWKDLRSKLAAYAQRLELLNTQSRTLDRHFQRWSLFTSLILIVCSVMMLGIPLFLRLRRKQRIEGNGTNKTCFPST